MAPNVRREALVLRITTFRPREPWAEIDRALRSRGIPSFLTQPGLLDAWFGRRGPDFDDEHVIASVWETSSGERAGPLLPETLVDSDLDLDGPSRLALPVVLDYRFPRPAPPTILRIYDGQTHAGQLDAYVKEAAQGVLVDGEGPDGPSAVCMSVDVPDRFVTVSLWTGWASIEASTGGDVGRPLATRNQARLADGGPTHYEVVLPL
ncbi:hypothetical protein BH23CHL8_BH23CHL8_20890 [soil metagenome]